MNTKRKAQIIEDYIGVCDNLAAVAKKHQLSQATVRGILSEYIKPVRKPLILQSAINIPVDEYIKSNWLILSRAVIARNTGMNETSVKYHAIKLGLPSKQRNSSFDSGTKVKVTDKNTGQVWESATEAGLDLGVSKVCVLNWCKAGVRFGFYS